MVILLAVSRVLADVGCYYQPALLTGGAIPIPHPAWFGSVFFGPSQSPKQDLSETSSLHLRVRRAVTRMMQMFLLLHNLVTTCLLIHLARIMFLHIKTRENL